MNDHTIAAAGVTAPAIGERTLAPDPQHTPAAAPRLTERQAIVLSAFTGKALCPMYLLQEAVDEKLGRVTYTHQYATAELWAAIKSAFRDEALAMLPEGFVR